MIFHAFNFLVFIWPSSFEPMGRIFFSVVILNMLHVQVNIFCEFIQQVPFEEIVSTFNNNRQFRNLSFLQLVLLVPS